MTRASEANFEPYNVADYTVHLLPGEGLLDARRRWELTTGRTGLLMVR